MATKEEQLAEAQAMYTEYLNAEKAVLQGQAYSIGDRTLTRADLSGIQVGRQYWASQVCAISTDRVGIRMKRIIPRDS
jgi:hypothetical protein